VSFRLNSDPMASTERRSGKRPMSTNLLFTLLAQIGHTVLACAIDAEAAVSQLGHEAFQAPTHVRIYSQLPRFSFQTSN
jgi:hypothetical protein